MSHPPSVLIVDDNVDTIRILSTALSAHALEVETAYDGQQALNVMKRCAPDLIVLDISMPVLNGFEVIAQLKHHPLLSDTPIIVFSALDSLDHPDIHLAGVIAFLSKGKISYLELVDMVVRNLPHCA